MKRRVCLHGINVKQKAQLWQLVHAALPHSSVTYAIEENYLDDNDVYKVEQACFTCRKLNNFVVHCAWGHLIISDSIQQVADITVTFEADDKQSVKFTQTVIKHFLLSELDFILEEPDYELRIAQLKGCYCLEKQDAYNSDFSRAALYCHLPWQIYGINKLWSEVLLQGAERPLLRQLRVKLRRFRSLFALLRPLLPREKSLQWQQVFKYRTNLLSAAREYDVLLMSCAKLAAKQVPESLVPLLPELTGLLIQLREKAAAKAVAGLSLNLLTLELAQFLLWIYSKPLSFKKNMKLLAFFKKRFNSWNNKLLNLHFIYEDMHDMDQMHKVRIKIKCFRYALQSVPEINTPPYLLRRLKYLQDTLGCLHDNYINQLRLKNILRAHPEIPNLRSEVSLLSRWEQEKAAFALHSLPEQWQDFCKLAKAWQKSNL